MTLSTFWQFRNTRTQKIVTLAFFIALSSGIQFIEDQVFPSSLPFRPGIANIIILIILSIYGIKEALLTAAARSILSALISGKLLGVPFFLSLSGGLASALVMGLLFEKNEELSVVGVSIIGSLVHNTVQLGVVYLFLVKNSGIFRLLPWLWLTALISGFIVGITARFVLKMSIVKKLRQAEGITG